MNDSPRQRYAQALACHKAGRLAEAEQLYRGLLEEEPDHAATLHMLGVLANQSGRNLEATDWMRRAVQRKPTPVYHNNLGIILQQLGRLDEAVAAFNSAIALKPDYAQAHFNLGTALKNGGRLDEAAQAFRAALHLMPDNGEAWFHLGNALKASGHLHEALQAFQRASQAMPERGEIQSNLGNLLAELGRPEESLRAFQSAIRLNPDRPEIHSNMGNTLVALGRFDEALVCFKQAVRLRPDFADAHYNEAFVHLLRGDLAAGWPKYEWRWRGGDRILQPRDFAPPQWQGEDISGRTILLHTEQGRGDTIQFARYAALVAARGARVLLEASGIMLRLLSALPGVDQLIATGDPLPDFDYHSPLLSLPGIFGTTRETIPADVPYLSAEAALVEKWRGRIGSEGFRIGIAWQGNPDPAADRGRSMPLACFRPLAAIAGVRLISLQKGAGLAQIKYLPEGMRVETLGEDFDAGPDAFTDTAAAMMSLDLIIACDTAIGHLAGALGRPAWLALKSVPHWVFMMEREDTPWYPHTRLFRQTQRGDWDDVFRRMAALLTRQLQES